MSICLCSREGGGNPNSSAQLQTCPFFSDLCRHVGLGINNDWEIETLSRPSAAARPSNGAQDKEREQKVNDGDCKKHDGRKIACVLQDEMCGAKFWAQMFGLCVRETHRERKGKIRTDSHGYRRWAASCPQISCLAQIA